MTAVGATRRAIQSGDHNQVEGLDHEDKLTTIAPGDGHQHAGQVSEPPAIVATLAAGGACVRAMR